MSTDKDGDSPMSPHELDADEEGQMHQNEADTIENSGEDNKDAPSNSNKSNILNSIQTEFASLSQRVLQLQNQVTSLQKANKELKSKVFGNETNRDNIDTKEEQENKIDESHTIENELDLVFLMDCTGSMGSYIKKGKESIMNIVQKVEESEKCDVRFSYIAYRDHPPQDKTFITKTHPFTKNPSDMQQYLSQYKASGGGDGPEAVTQALYEAVQLKYRENAIKICVIIADAPPHGLNQGGNDGFPNGNPLGHDPIKIAKQMAKLGIILYVVACEPSLSKYKGAHDLMAGLAKITEGRYLPLTGAHLLPDVIINGAKEEVSLKKLEKFVEQKMKEIKRATPNISQAAMTRKVTMALNSHGHQYNSNTITPVYGNYNMANINTYTMSPSLRVGVSRQKILAQPKPNFHTIQTSNSVPSLHDDSSARRLVNRISNTSEDFE